MKRICLPLIEVAYGIATAGSAARSSFIVQRREAWTLRPSPRSPRRTRGSQVTLCNGAVQS